jgi:N-acetylglucosamine-6-phosphate deacetylase
MIALIARRLYMPSHEIENPLVLIEDGIVRSVFSRTEQPVPANAKVIDLTMHHAEAILAPGFVDIHIHGGAGIDVSHAAPHEVHRLNQFLATRGVTAYFPTTVTAPLDQICTALERLADAIEGGPNSGSSEMAVQARPLGIHLEGPFLSHKRRGVHPPENLLEPTLKTFDRLWQAARGHIRMMTNAPELPGAMEVIAEAARRKVCVSIGHSDADTAAARQAINSGARHATHTFNAMRPLDHRDPGILGETLTDDRITADIIADGIHVAPEVVKLFLLAKGFEHSVLITDATAATGMPDGTYQLGPIQVEVKDGRCTMDGKLAGSVLTMDRAVRNVMKFSNWTLRDAVRAATFNPARATALTQQGEVAPGAEANLVLLSPGGEVLKTMVKGCGF